MGQQDAHILARDVKFYPRPGGLPDRPLPYAAVGPARVMRGCLIVDAEPAAHVALGGGIVAPAGPLGLGVPAPDGRLVVRSDAPVRVYVLHYPAWLRLVPRRWRLDVADWLRERSTRQSRDLRVRLSAVA